MQVFLPYGRAQLVIEADESWDVIEPVFIRGIDDERGAVVAALRRPLGCAPLREMLEPGDEVCVVIPDITRPAPTAKLVSWLLEEMAGFPDLRLLFLVGTGSHRPCDEQEIKVVLGEAVAGGYPVMNHDSRDEAALKMLGRTSLGIPVWLNSRYLDASKRVTVGLLEPHFFAGFSGGPKAVVPGVAGIETIMGIHSAQLIDDPGTTWGKLDGNPVYEQICEACGHAPPDFSINVAVNKAGEITGVFTGDVFRAHREGSAFVRDLTMRMVSRAYDIVITTNGGWPLDQNLYQTVKGLSAAAQITRPGGCIVCASECSEGLPSHGNFARLLREARWPGALLEAIRAPGFRMEDQWEAQVLAQITLRATVFLYSSLPEDDVRSAFLYPVSGVEEGIRRAIEVCGGGASVAVLPQGPFTIPYVGGWAGRNARGGL
ncbi:MAG: nickel-dependent lactate racemase [Bacillota bacterium]